LWGAGCGPADLPTAGQLHQTTHHEAGSASWLAAESSLCSLLLLLLLSTVHCHNPPPQSITHCHSPSFTTVATPKHTPPRPASAAAAYRKRADAESPSALLSLWRWVVVALVVRGQAVGMSKLRAALMLRCCCGLEHRPALPLPPRQQADAPLQLRRAPMRRTCAHAAHLHKPPEFPGSAAEPRHRRRLGGGRDAIAAACRGGRASDSVRFKTPRLSNI